MTDIEENIKFSIENIKESTPPTIEDIETILFDENKKKQDVNKKTIYTGYIFLGSGIILSIGNKLTKVTKNSKPSRIFKTGSNILSGPLLTSGILLTTYGILNSETYKL